MEVPGIGMDVIGLFHRCAEGYHFVLVLVDYAACYLYKERGTGAVAGHLLSCDPERDPD